MKIKIKKIVFVFSVLFFSSCIDFILNQNESNSYISDNYETSSKFIRFFVLSDWGFNGSDTQIKVAQAMALTADKNKTDFILTCGDNFQSQGVTSIYDSLWYYNFENVYNYPSLKIPWYPALGNHDYILNPDAQIEYNSLNPLWNMPSKYYSFTKEIDGRTGILFVVIDTNNLISEIQKTTKDSDVSSVEQIVWLKNILKNHQEKWIIVTGHHPVYSSAWAHGDTPELKKFLKPLLEEYKVDFYICGHDHHFEHVNIKGSQTHYIVTGTGGFPRAAYKGINTLFSASIAGFTCIKAQRNYISLNFINYNGESIYKFEKVKQTYSSR